MAQGTIYVENRDSVDLFVTIVDRNTASGKVIWTDERLNENETRQLTCEIDGGFQANIDWVAKQVDDTSIVTSGSEKVNENSTLSVYAS